MLLSTRHVRASFSPLSFLQPRFHQICVCSQRLRMFLEVGKINEILRFQSIH